MVKVKFTMDVHKGVGADAAESTRIYDTQVHYVLKSNSVADVIFILFLYTLSFIRLGDKMFSSNWRYLFSLQLKG